MTPERLPLVLIGGGQRCGTTWLYRQLERHPAICTAVPSRPEPKYFLRPGPIDARDYLASFFQHRSEGQVLVEKSTSYSDHVECASRMKALFPEVRVVFILRDPVERALSNYFFSVKGGLETRTLEEVFLAHRPAPDYSAALSTNPFLYVERGDYVRFLAPFFEELGRDRVFVGLFEKMIHSREGLVDLFRFLGVGMPEGFAAGMEWTRRENPAERNQAVTPAVRKVLERRCAPWIERLRTFLPGLDLPWTPL